MTFDPWLDLVLDCGQPEEECTTQAVWHLLWHDPLTGGMNHAVACEVHRSEAQKQWPADFIHTHGVDCGMPGAVFDVEANRCVVRPDIALPELTATRDYAHSS